MVNIDMSKVIELAERDEFWALRGKAIQTYANLEQSFASLFSLLSGANSQASLTILFKITSSDARNKILTKLFRQKFGAQYRSFANSLFDQLRPIDIERNEIVHWNAVCQMGLGTDGKEAAILYLMPPALRTADEIAAAPRKDTAAILTFSAKCSFYSRLINMFYMVESTMVSTIPDDVKTPWRDIFAQPVVYPPPSGHPLFQTSPAPGNHVQSFLT